MFIKCDQESCSVKPMYSVNPKFNLLPGDNKSDYNMFLVPKVPKFFLTAKCPYCDFIMEETKEVFASGSAS